VKNIGVGEFASCKARDWGIWKSLSTEMISSLADISRGDIQKS